jgi:hypothetical protein
MRELLIGIPQPIAGPLGGGVLGAVFREGPGEAFGSTPRGHDLSHELLHVPPSVNEE